MQQGLKQQVQQVPENRRKRVAAVLSVYLALGVVLFGLAGRLDWLMGWVLIVLLLGVAVLNALWAGRKHPDLLAERAVGVKAAKAWDRVLAPLVGVGGYLLVCVVAGLDQRFGWSSVPALLTWVGLGVAVAASIFVSWAMAANRFFSSVVRIQTDRGHAVTSTGPYAWVRHPGYVGMFLMVLALPVMLDSTWALIPGGLTAALTVLRTALEDRTLHEELPGYQEYASRVRYRLLPWVW